MAKTVERGIFSIAPKVRRMYQVVTNLETQMSRLPYFFDEKSRWGITSKKDMLKDGITSPDIADTFAFAFLENINYTPANKVGFKGSDKDKQQWEDLDELAALMG